jgi:hypothetical protein
LFVVEVHDLAHVHAHSRRDCQPNASDAIPWDTLRLPGERVVQRVVGHAGRVDLEHGLASSAQEVNAPLTERPAKDDGERSEGPVAPVPFRRRR